jgi:transcription elongation factor SPT5
MSMFQGQNDNLAANEAMAAAAAEHDHTQFSVGDRVVAVGGELNGLQGIVRKITKEAVSFHPTNNEVADILNNADLSLPPSQLRKYFQLSDHVKVTNGRYTGETGMVVEVPENYVVVLTDSDKKVRLPFWSV